MASLAGSGTIGLMLFAIAILSLASPDGGLAGLMPLGVAIFGLTVVAQRAGKIRRWVLHSRKKSLEVLDWMGLRRLLRVHLQEVAAVQILDAGHLEGAKQGASRSFELNMVFADGERLCVERQTNGRRVRRHGEQIAEFLGAPLVDHMGGF